jgi:hypothetical protein
MHGITWNVMRAGRRVIGYFLARFLYMVCDWEMLGKPERLGTCSHRKG